MINILRLQKKKMLVLLYGNPSLDIVTNSIILNATIDFTLSTKRFEEAIF